MRETAVNELIDKLVCSGGLAIKVNSLATIEVHAKSIRVVTPLGNYRIDSDDTLDLIKGSIKSNIEVIKARYKLNLGVVDNGTEVSVYYDDSSGMYTVLGSFSESKYYMDYKDTRICELYNMYNDINKLIKGESLYD